MKHPIEPTLHAQTSFKKLIGSTAGGKLTFDVVRSQTDPKHTCYMYIIMCNQRTLQLGNVNVSLDLGCVEASIG